MENDGKRTVHTGNVAIFLARKIKSNNVSRVKRKASRNTGPVAAGIARERVLGANEMLQ